MIRRKEYIVERIIHDSIYLINTKQNYLNDKCYLYEINGIGSFIWNCISGITTTENIIELIKKQVDIESIDVDELNNDVKYFIDMLAEEGFVEVDDEGN